MVAQKILSAAFAAALLANHPAMADPVTPPAQPAPCARLLHDADAADILIAARDGAATGLIELRDVRIVDPVEGMVTPGQAVIVQGPRIVWVGEAVKAPSPKDMKVIDGGGRFLAPGLVDMHVHAGAADGWLLDLAAGVTTVRDMDGFPWILRARDQINRGAMLGPTTYVAGTIIASAPLDGYAVVAANSEDARRIVRQQAACGYDFIKVHNLLSQPAFDAIAEQASRLGLDLVGHVPHNISLDHALHAGHMRTTEHLKGFLIDQTLLPSDEAYAPALAGAETWITPTLYTRFGYDRGAWARAQLEGPIARYAAPEKRKAWRDMLAHPDPGDVSLGERFRATQDTDMARLVPLHPHWLAGTDAAGYPFNLMGFALLDELQLLQDHGLSPPEAIRAATVEPAAAMRQDGDFGRIARGMRADMVLLDGNPLDGVSAYRANQGVMSHGVWLDRPALDHALARLSEAYADRPATPLNRRTAQALYSRLKADADQGFVFEAQALIDLAATVRAAGLGDIADRLVVLADVPGGGPCAEILPH